MIAKVAGLLAADHVNIAALTCDRDKRGGNAMLCIELDQTLGDPAQQFLLSWPEMDWVRMVQPVMDAGIVAPVLLGTTA